MDYQVSTLVYSKILSFYSNVAKKYRHTYSYETLQRDYRNAIFSIRMIENGLLRRVSTVKPWKDKGFHMATSKDRRWNFAYRIVGDTIYVEDARHSQNIHDSTILSEAGAEYGK